MTEYSVSGNDDRRNKEQKLIALDVDGTLVDHDGAMTDEVREAARAVVDAGHQVIIATGRSLQATLPVIERIGLQTGFGVCCNGGVTVRLDPSLPGGFEVVHKETFSPRDALTALRSTLPAAMYAVEAADGEFLSTSSFQDASFGIRARSVDFEELLDARAVRVVVHSQEVPLAEFEAAVQGIGLHGVTYSVGWSAWLDIAAAGVTKASALEKLRADLRLDASSTVAVGDGFNDVEMLRWAHRGVAMGQAPQGVQDAASEITASVYDDGAARVLRSILA
ncbi:Cof subfamily protein (haloacid dehalogenase superfamily) [Arthrobacter russicus]|uniref:Cof subfamily protein (Haloacid dehalogenase superfamily) n=2 Tax=Arthrobacter russicus TaxID=172040 RepID=A0ABU1JBU6_9MICC|nr:Cof subfamily protein (haloacid dehalogenase superfamily) [Arthrobacter russicus]